MTRREFDALIRQKLYGLPEEEITRSVEFYEEMIADRMDDGMPEEDAVAALGPVDAIVEDILKDTPLPKLIREKTKQKRSMKGWEIALLILGFPLWLPLLIVFAGTIFVILVTVYAVIWVLVICVYAGVLALGACLLAGIAAGIILLVRGFPAAGLLLLGGGMVVCGFAVLFVLIAIWTTRLAIFVCKKIGIGIKKCFVGKGGTA